MSEKKTYTVHRAMHADGRDYARGDTREMTVGDAADLIRSGALSIKGEDPATPAPAVRHTFGTVESRVNREGYTTAVGDPVKVPEAATAAPATPTKRRTPAA